MWSQILISLSSVFSIVVVLNMIPRNYPDVKATASAALFFVLIIEIISFISFDHDALVSEWLIVLVFTSLLAVLLMIVRTVKPEIVRYPYPIVYMPFVVVLVYPVIQGTTALTDLVLMLLQGGAVIVLFLLYAGHRKWLKREWLYIAGGILLLSAYITFWFLEDSAGWYYDWTWQLFTALGMISVALEAPRFLKQAIGG